MPQPTQHPHTPPTLPPLLTLASSTPLTLPSTPPNLSTPTSPPTTPTLASPPTTPTLASLPTTPTLASPPTTPTPTSPTVGEQQDTPMTTLAEVGIDLLMVMETRIPDLFDPEITEILKKPYLERVRFANLEMVHKILQAPPLEEDKCPLVTLERRLLHLRRVLGLLLLVLPQSLHELTEALWNDDLQNNFFRQESEKNILDVSSCRECYIKDPLGVCRQVFYCKFGADVSRRTMPSSPDILSILNG
nr:cyclin-dependent kinase 12-like [Procambarus clarkii]